MSSEEEQEEIRAEIRRLADLAVSRYDPEAELRNRAEQLLEDGWQRKHVERALQKALDMLGGAQ